MHRYCNASFISFFWHCITDHPFLRLIIVYWKYNNCSLQQTWTWARLNKAWTAAQPSTCSLVSAEARLTSLWRPTTAAPSYLTCCVKPFTTTSCTCPIPSPTAPMTSLKRTRAECPSKTRMCLWVSTSKPNVPVWRTSYEAWLLRPAPAEKRTASAKPSGVEETSWRRTSASRGSLNTRNPVSPAPKPAKTRSATNSRSSSKACSVSCISSRRRSRTCTSRTTRSSRVWSWTADTKIKSRWNPEVSAPPSRRWRTSKRLLNASWPGLCAKASMWSSRSSPRLF